MVNLKSTREIALMRRAGLAVWEAHQIAARMVRPGVTTAAIDRAIAEHFERLGGQPLFKNYPNSVRNKPPFPAVCCMSVNEAVVHGIPNDRPLKEGDILSLDTGVRLNGWCGDSAWTYAVGRISPQVQRLLDVTEGSLHLAIRVDELEELLERDRPRDGRPTFATTASRPSSASWATASAATCTRIRRCRTFPAGVCAAAATSESSRGW